MEVTIKRLLLFTYCGAFFLAVTCQKTTFDRGDPRNGLLQQIVFGNQEQSSLSRQSRQNRFSSNNIPFSNFRPNTGGFNWGSNQNSLRNEEGSQNIIFEDYDDLLTPNIPSSTGSPPPSSTVPIPGMATTRSSCEINCPATNQFDPVCGDNNVTYTNIYWLQCAQRCGRDVSVKYIGACPRVP